MSPIIEVSASHQKSYSITLGRDLWEAFNMFCSDHYSSQKVFVVVDENVHRCHGQNIEKHISLYFDEVELYEVPEGEKSKSVDQWNKIIDWVLKKGVERSTPLVAIGGGVTGDLGGFAAASILRGIPLIHVPTSLLAMVDSSIGGKTGVNHHTGKNLIGSFYQPDAVFADVHYLSTLEEREWVNGLAEILKYGAIRDPEIFDLARQRVEQGFDPSDEWIELIRRCAAIKADIVQKDTLESGIREYLNFGHTFGHALEKKTGYDKISHGEAVFVGMLAAVHASREMGADIEQVRLDGFLSLYDIEVNLEPDEIDELIKLMRRDKKVVNQSIRLVLLQDWAEPYVEESKNESLIKSAWQSAFSKLT